MIVQSNSIVFDRTYPRDADLFSGQCYQPFEWLGPEDLKKTLY